jgi:hypothetical protein
MDEYIYQNKNHENSYTISADEFYTIVGREDYRDDKNNPRLQKESMYTYAKKIYRQDGTFKSYIRILSNGYVYNPLSQVSEKNYAFLDRVCKEGTKFREVSPKVFDMYIHFLRTKNISWINNVERELI